MKNVLLLIDDYIPDSTKVAAKMMHELACEFIASGHNVTVITPSSQIETNSHVEYIDSVKVIRFKSGPIKNCGFFIRAINESLLPYRARHYTRNDLNGQDFDIIVSYSPSIFWGRFTRQLKKQFSCPCYLILRDFFPQWVIDNGMIKESSPAAKYFRYCEKLNYEAADVIGIQSAANIHFFEKCFGNEYPVSLLYNWASVGVSSQSYQLKRKLNIEDKTVFFYGGNIGRAQDMANLLRLAIRLKDRDDAHFVFLGIGDEVDLVRNTIEQESLLNTTYLPPVTQDDFKAILKEVDIGLFSLSREHQSHNFPGKILGYMVNKIPILGSVNPGNDLKLVIEEFEAGFVTINGEDDLFYHYAKSLLDDEILRKQAGENSEKLLHDRFTVNSAAKEILSILDNQG